MSIPILAGLSQVTAKFSRFQLDFDYDAEHPENSHIEARIEAASFDSGIDQRDEHVRSEDFLHAAEFPEIHYESFEVIQEGERLRVIGVLTMRGVAKDVELDVEIIKRPHDQHALGFHATTAFDRQEFGVRYKHADIPDFIGDRVAVELHILSHPKR